MNRFLAKILCSILLWTIIYSPVATIHSLQVHQAQAAAGVATEATQIAQLGVDGVTAGNTGASAGFLGSIFGVETASLVLENLDNLKEYVLDPLAWAFMKLLIQQVSASIQQWIISGFQGSPGFIQDMEGLLEDTADRAVGELLRRSAFGFVCDPFKLEVSIALYTSYTQGKANDPTACTLSGSVENIENFIDGAFADAGGWVSWHESTIRPTNNAMGALFDAQAKAGVRIVNAQTGKTIQSLFDQGFKSKSFCALFESDEAPDGIGAAASGARGDRLRGGPSTPAAGSGDTNNDGVVDADEARVVRWDSWNAGAEGACLEDLVNTPGAAVFEFFKDSLDMPQMGAVVADEISEIVATLLVTLAQKALQGSMGLLGLGESGSGPSGASYLQDIGAQIGDIAANTNIDLSRFTGPTQAYIDLLNGVGERAQAIFGPGGRAETVAARIATDFPECRFPSQFSAGTAANNDWGAINPTLASAWEAFDDTTTKTQAATPLLDGPTVLAQLNAAQEVAGIQSTLNTAVQLEAFVNNPPSEEAILGSCSDGIDNALDRNFDGQLTVEFDDRNGDGVVNALDAPLVFGASSADGADENDPDCRVTFGDRNDPSTWGPYDPNLTENDRPDIETPEAFIGDAMATLIQFMNTGVLKNEGDVSRLEADLRDFNLAEQTLNQALDQAYNFCASQQSARDAADDAPGGGGSGGDDRA